MSRILNEKAADRRDLIRILTEKQLISVINFNDKDGLKKIKGENEPQIFSVIHQKNITNDFQIKVIENK